MKAQHEAFAFAVARGKEPKAAFIEIYPNVTTDGAIRTALSRLLKRPDIQNAIVDKKKELVTTADALAVKELQTEGYKYNILSITLKRHILHRIATGKMKTKVWDPKAKEYYFSYPSDDDKIKAIKLDAELTGEGYRPPEPGNTGGTITQNNTTYIRKTVFNTRVTTTRPQTIHENVKE